MVATARIAATAQIISSYSPDGANVHSAHLIHGFLGPHESTAKRNLNRFSRFCTYHRCAQQRQADRQTSKRAKSNHFGDMEYVYSRAC